MIAYGIKFLCRKIVDLVNIIGENGLDFDSCITFTQVKHTEWVSKILETIDKLKNWELNNNGEQTFSKAFDLLAAKLMVLNTERKALIKNSSSKRVLPTENSHLDFSNKASDRPNNLLVPISQSKRIESRSRTENNGNLTSKAAAQKGQYAS